MAFIFAWGKFREKGNIAKTAKISTFTVMPGWATVDQVS